MSLSSAKIIEVVFESAIETYEAQKQLLPLCTFQEPDPARMQNSGNTIWQIVQQHRPVLTGWDLSGQAQGIIEESCPFVLEDPRNDLIQLRADDVRDMGFWTRAGIQSGDQQATDLNSRIANAVALQGSLFYRSNTASGFTFLANGQTQQDARQLSRVGGRNFVLNSIDSQKFANELSGRQTLQGRPEATWVNGQIGKNIAEYDVYVGSYLPALVGGANPAATVTGNQSFVPVGGVVDTVTNSVTNTDYRSAIIPISDSSNYNVGDKVVFTNTATTVKAIGLASKNDTTQAMTFSVTQIIDGTHIRVFPKPIAYDDPALTSLQQAYANIDTQILNGATVDRLNTDASAKTNLFWAKEAVTVTGGTIPAQLFAKFAGKQVVTKKLSNGLTMYMVYDGDPTTMNFTMRIFTWAGITVNQPQNAGVAVTYT